MWNGAPGAGFNGRANNLILILRHVQTTKKWLRLLLICYKPRRIYARKSIYAAIESRPRTLKMRENVQLHHERVFSWYANIKVKSEERGGRARHSGVEIEVRGRGGENEKAIERLREEGEAGCQDLSRLGFHSFQAKIAKKDIVYQNCKVKRGFEWRQL